MHRLFLLAVFTLAVLPAGAEELPHDKNGRPDFAEQVRARTEIERFYHERRQWPVGNPQPKPALDEVLPVAQIEALVRNSLAMEVLLRERWGVTITPDAIRREFARISRESRDPRGLAELFRRLRNDPDLITGGQDAAGYLNTGGRYNPAGNSWITVPATTVDFFARRSEHTAVWTGNEMIVWGGRGAGSYSDGRRYQPATDSWSVIAAPPSGFMDRYAHRAIWTGTQMIVWGGRSTGAGIYYSDGARYNPAADSWALMAGSGPAYRAYHSALWTGTRMIVWGGQYDNCPVDCSIKYRNTGGAYDPVGDSWVATPLTGAPAARSRAAVVWTGSEMIVWGGFDGNIVLASGGRWAPFAAAWNALPLTGAPPGRDGPAGIWSGSEMIVWGGSAGGTGVASGGRYSLASDTWSPMTATGAPSARYEHTALWGRGEMIIWGGSDPAAANSGARYQPVTDSWTPIASIGAPAPRADHSAVWTGNAMLVWGGTDGGFAPVNTGGANHYEPPDGPANGLRVSRSATLDLTWTAAAGAAAYRVLACQPGGTGCTPATLLGTPATGSFSEPLDSVSRFYAVESSNGCGNTP